MDYQANADARLDDGRTPLHEAILAKNVEGAIALIKAGADIEAEECDGIRPLHLAAKAQCVELVEILLAYGASTDAHCMWGTVFDIARETGRADILKIVCESDRMLKKSRGPINPHLEAKVLLAKKNREAVKEERERRKKELTFEADSKRDIGRGNGEKENRTQSMLAFIQGLRASRQNKPRQLLSAVAVETHDLKPPVVQTYELHPPSGQKPSDDDDLETRSEEQSRRSEDSSSTKTDSSDN